MPSAFLVRLSVNFFSVAYLYDQHDQKSVFYSVDHTIIPYPETAKITRTFQFGKSCRTGVLCERRNIREDFLPGLSGHTLKVSLNTGSEEDLINHQPISVNAVRWTVLFQICQEFLPRDKLLVVGYLPDRLQDFQ